MGNFKKVFTEIFFDDGFLLKVLSEKIRIFDLKKNSSIEMKSACFIEENLTNFLFYNNFNIQLLPLFLILH
jgi:hypothetical protein